VDNPDEVGKFRGLPPDFSVLVRLSFPNPGAKSDLSSKFGVAPEDAERLVGHCLRRRAARRPVHVPRRQPDTSAAPWVHAIRRTLALMRRLEHATASASTRSTWAAASPSLRRARALARGARSRHPRGALGRADRYRIIIEPGASSRRRR
jgi:ornithine decarboxylase